MSQTPWMSLQERSGLSSLTQQGKSGQACTTGHRQPATLNTNWVVSREPDSALSIGPKDLIHVGFLVLVGD